MKKVLFCLFFFIGGQTFVFASQSNECSFYVSSEDLVVSDQGLFLKLEKRVLLSLESIGKDEKGVFVIPCLEKGFKFCCVHCQKIYTPPEGRTNSSCPRCKRNNFHPPTVFNRKNKCIK